MSCPLEDIHGDITLIMPNVIEFSNSADSVNLFAVHSGVGANLEVVGLSLCQTGLGAGKSCRLCDGGDLRVLTFRGSSHVNFVSGSAVGLAPCDLGSASLYLLGVDGCRSRSGSFDRRYDAVAGDDLLAVGAYLGCDLVVVSLALGQTLIGVGGAGGGTYLLIGAVLGGGAVDVVAGHVVASLPGDISGSCGLGSCLYDCRSGRLFCVLCCFVFFGFCCFCLV